MQASDSEIVTPRKRARRTFTRSFKRQLVSKALSGETSVSQLAIDHKLNANMLRKWIRDAQAEQPVQAMLPVSVVPEKCADTDRCVLEIVLYGATLRFYHGWDPIAVAAMLKAAQ